MKLLFTAFAVFITTALAEDDDLWVAGRNVRAARAVTETPTATTVCASSSNGFSYCSSTPGCTNAGTFQCFNGAALATKPCTDPTPYCSGGSCVAAAPVGCSASNFICPGEGYFPKYDDCYTYYYCYFDPAANDFVAEPRVCPTNYPFNPTGPQEKVCLRGGVCTKASCTAGRSAEWKAMNYNGFTRDNIALYCVSGKPVRVDACPAGLSIDLLQTNTKRCFVRCVKDYQVAIYEGDNKKYYLCLGGTAYVEQCNFGQIFDANTLTCITAPSTAAPTTTAAGGTTTAAGATTTAAGATTTAAGATTTVTSGVTDSTTPAP